MKTAPSGERALGETQKLLCGLGFAKAQVTTLSPTDAELQELTNGLS